MGWLADILQELPLSAALKSKLEKLEAEHDQLKVDLTKAHEENKKLQEQLKQYQQGGLSSEEEAIIKLLANGPQDGLSVEAIAGNLQMHPTKAKHFLNRLYENEYLGQWGDYGSGQIFFTLYPKGQEYAVTRGFV